MLYKRDKLTLPGSLMEKQWKEAWHVIEAYTEIRVLSPGEDL